jgi:hypothetical protein
LQAAGISGFPRGDDKMQLNLNAKLRLGLMGVTVLAVLLAGVFGTGWATPVRAEGSVTGAGIVEEGDAGGAAAAGACVLTAPVVLTGANNVTKTIDLGIGSVQLLSNLAGIGIGSIRPLTVPIVEFTANLVGPASLEKSPPNWTVLSCGIQASAKVEAGDAVTYVVKGQKICFDLPVGATAAYNTLRVGYFDTTLARWVTFAKTVVGASEACHSSFRLLPSTYALFGANLKK